jgi:hypothetical protein
MHNIPVCNSSKGVVKIVENQVLSAGLRPGPDTLKAGLSSLEHFVALGGVSSSRM